MLSVSYLGLVAHFMVIRLAGYLTSLPIALDFKLSVTLGHPATAFANLPITFVVVQGSLAKKMNTKFSIYFLWSLVDPLPL
jgi:hypothetical protein